MKSLEGLFKLWISGKLNPGFRFLTLFFVFVLFCFFQVLCYVLLCYVLILFVCLLCHVWVQQFSFQNEYHAAIFGLNLMSHGQHSLTSVERPSYLFGFRKRMTSRSPRSLICDSSALRSSISDLFDFW